MSLKDVVAGRAERIVKVDVPGIGEVRIKRLSGREVEALPEAQFGSAMVAATIMCDGEDKPFFASTVDADRDLGIRNALLKASKAVNRVDVEDAEKK